MSNLLPKYRIEFFTLLSGIISTIVSSTGYFYGRVADTYGPIATFILVAVWVAFYGFILYKKAEADDNQSEDGTSQQTIPVAFLIIPWIVSLICWGVGVSLHTTKEKQKVISGYVVYGNDQKLQLPNARLKITYANKEITINANNIGYFEYVIDLQPNANTIIINVEDREGELSSTTKVINLKMPESLSQWSANPDNYISLLYEVK